MARQDIQARVHHVAEHALVEQHYVSPIDVLLGLGWLAPSHVDRWRQDRVPYLEREVQASLGKTSTAMAELRRWARDKDLRPSETTYVARTRDRRQLQFSASADPEIERTYRTHWISPELTAHKREQLLERQNRPPDLIVIAASKSWTCAKCRREVDAGGLLMMADAGCRPTRSVRT